jgi:TRAP-type C4-dicarboxylate transport system permease small subunit
MKDEIGHELEFSFKSITGRPIERWVYKLTLVMGLISALGITFMMLITVYDVLMRFFFAKPIYGVYELVGMFLVLTTAFGMALCQKDKAHITITLITDMLPAKMKTTSVLFGLLMSFICFGIITLQMFIQTIKYFERGTGGLSSHLGINWGYISALFVVGSFVFTIVLLMQFIQTLGHLTKR